MDRQENYLAALDFCSPLSKYQFTSTAQITEQVVMATNLC
jgi:hypothetical protein